jgi:hypothetical protein
LRAAELTAAPVTHDPQRDVGAVRPDQRRAAVDRDIGQGAVAARRHGRAPEGGGGLFAIGDLPNARKPANGEPSGTEPGPLADPQGPTKHPSDVVKFNDLDGEFVVR